MGTGLDAVIGTHANTDTIHISYCVHIESIEPFECLVNLTIMTVAYKTKISCFCHRNVLCNAATIRWESKVLSTYSNFFFYPETYTSATLYPDIYTHRYSPKRFRLQTDQRRHSIMGKHPKTKDSKFMYMSQYTGR